MDGRSTTSSAHDAFLTGYCQESPCTDIGLLLRVWILALEQCFDSGLYLNFIARIETEKLFYYLAA